MSMRITKKVVIIVVLVMMTIMLPSMAIEYEAIETDNFTYHIPKEWVSQYGKNERSHYATSIGDPTDGYYYIEEFTRPEGTDDFTTFKEIIDQMRQNPYALSDANHISKQINIDDRDAQLFGLTIRINDITYNSAGIVFQSNGKYYMMLYTKQDNPLDDLEQQAMEMAKGILFPNQTEKPADAPVYEVKEYKWSTSRYHHNDLVIKNTSGFDAHIEVTVLFYDKEGTIVGVQNSDQRACENGYETFWSIYNDIAFDRAEYTISVSPDTYYKGVQSSIEHSTSIVNNKVIFTAKNISNEAVSYLEYHLLYLDKNGNIVDTDWGYLDDKDSELKPGKTEFREDKTSEEFATVQLYTKGR